MDAVILHVQRSVKMSEKNRTIYQGKDLTKTCSGARKGRSVSVHAMDKSHRDYIEASKRAWDEATKNLPNDAFADNVPDDIDRDGAIKTSVTHIPSRSALEDI